MISLTSATTPETEKPTPKTDSTFTYAGYPKSTTPETECTILKNSDGKPLLSNEMELLESGVEIPDGFYMIGGCGSSGDSTNVGGMIIEQVASKPDGHRAINYSDNSIITNWVENITGLDFPDEIERKSKKTEQGQRSRATTIDR